MKPSLLTTCEIEEDSEVEADEFICDELPSDNDIESDLE